MRLKMPFGDRTGPLGTGPVTGRGMGFCRGYDRPGYYNRPWGTGWGRGRSGGTGYGGGGGGFRNRYWWRVTGMPGWAGYWGPPEAVGSPYPLAHPENTQMYPKDEKRFIKDQLKFHEDALNELKSRLEQLDKSE